MKEKIENQEIKEYLINMSTNSLQNCDVFTRTFGKRFAENRLKTNLYKVYTNEINKKNSGYATTKGKGASTITICCKTETNEPLSVEEVEDDIGLKSTLLHEAIHIILEKTKQECKKANIKSGSGLIEIIEDAEIGRGLNEGLTNWIVRKAGFTTSSYKTLTNFMEELELAIGEDNVMALGKGNFVKKVPKLLKMDINECLEIFAISDEIYMLGTQIKNDIIILNTTQKYLMRDSLDSKDREEVESQYKKLLQTEAKEEYKQEEFKYQTFLQEENKTDTPENRKDFFENQIKEKTSRYLKLKTKFESIIYERYFKNEFEQVIKSGTEPNLQQLRKFEDLWSLITEEGIEVATPISEFKQKYEELREQYLKNISVKAKEEFNNGKLSGNKLVELLRKSAGFGSDLSNTRLLSTVAQLIAPNSVNALYVQDILTSLDLEQLENINKYKMSISTYCAENINIPVYIKDGKIVSMFETDSKWEFPQMKITSEKELKDENVDIFDFTFEPGDSYITIREEALQIYQKALSLDSATKMKILERMIVLESRDGTQTPYIISSGHVLPAFSQKGSTIDINLAPNPVELPTVPNENAFSKFMISIKRKFSKNPEGDVYYNNASTTNERSKIFRKSMRLEEDKSNKNEYVMTQNVTKILEVNQTKDDGLPR